MYLVCGEALFDVFIEDGENSSSFQMNARAGGSPFNVAIGVARLGGQSALLTGIASDMLGNRLAQLLQDESVSTDYLVRSDKRTTLSLVSLDDSGQPEYVFYGDGSADCGLTKDELPLLGKEIDGIHFGSYSLAVLPVADAFSSLLENVGNRFISVDPNIRPTIEPDMDIWRDRVTQYSKHAHLVKISAEDIGYLYPTLELQNIVDGWLASGVELVVVTDGGNEVRGWTRSGHQCSVKPQSNNVVDTVGAGDSFQAALLTRLALNGDPGKAVTAIDEQGLYELLNFAAQAASITCSRRGADLPYAQDL